MKRNSLFVFVYIFVSIFLFQCSEQALLVYKNTVPSGVWGVSTSWLPAQIPIFSDTVLIKTNGDVCIAENDISFYKMEVGDTSDTTPPTAKTSLEVRGSVIGQDVIVYVNGTLNFNTTTPTKTVFLNSILIFGTVNNFKTLNMTNGTIGLINYFENKPGARVEFAYPLFSKNTGQFYNNAGSTYFRGLANNGTVLLQNSRSNVMDKVSIPSALDVLQYESGKISLENATLDVTAQYFALADSSSLLVKGGSKFNFVYPGFSNTSYAQLYLQGSSECIFEDSQGILKGVQLNALENSIISLNKSSITSNFNILLRQNAEFHIINHSRYTATYYIGLAESSKLFSEDSSINLIDGMFGMFDTSFMELLNSNLTIQGQNPNVTSLVGLAGSAKLRILEGSIMNLNSYFICANSSEIVVSNSSFISVTKNLMMFNASRLFIEDGATLKIDSNVGITNQASIQTKGNAKILVNEILYVDQDGSFNFEDTQVTITQSLIFASLITPSWITRSNINVDGTFLSLGHLGIVDSEISVSDNLTTAFDVVCNNSNTVIESGNFVIFNKFTSFNSSFTAKKGVLEIMPEGHFSCTKCVIDIQSGIFILGLGSNLSIVNTTFINSGGTVESKSPLKLSLTGVTNQGQFILKSDITTVDINQTYIIENRGEFTINGPNSTTINIKFSNNGKLNIEQDSTFEYLVQDNGTISLNNFTISSSQVITVNAGSLQGNGQINGQVVNKGNLGDSEKVNIIIIIGNLTQSESSSTVAYVTDSENSHFNISENILLNGTLKIRIEDTISDTNQTKQIITSQSSNNSQFKKIEVVYYNKETKTEYPPCKPIETEQTEKGLAVLLKSGNPPNQGCEGSKSKKSITVPLTVGLVVGVVGLSALSAAVYVFKDRVGPRVLARSIGRKLKILKN
ncbi:hypothetical protein DLAC_00487 [Tieghemostelium lacteum]|uniref:Transmembrane protein n=1 Tax=Tieghemostelium lacteum TaxID=361077 RepID=A0A152A9U9_TIELA|nr:hypothetical protein DLAC_00487 [Tieghemostelium lacteum]|eukprot:KYR02999.1 hypothetical protein DLAC_00487 [Tieghemostelium lacteum]